MPQVCGEHGGTFADAVLLLSAGVFLQQSLLQAALHAGVQVFCVQPLQSFLLPWA
jgi:hypothetical protein